jgi:hypothetical protein
LHKRFIPGDLEKLDDWLNKLGKTAKPLLSPAGLLPQSKPSPFTDPAAFALISSLPANNTPTTDKDGESMGFYRSYN